MRVHFSVTRAASRGNLLLVALGAALLALCVMLLGGAGRDPQWLAPQPAPKATAAGATPASVPELPEQQWVMIWRQPLFSPKRQADAATIGRSADTGLAGLTLSGIVLNGQAQWALLRQGPRNFTLKVGQRLSNGWMLEALGPREATFSHQGQQRRLSLATPRLPPPGEDAAPRLPTPPVLHTDAPEEAEPLEDAP